MPRTKTTYREILVAFDKDNTTSILPWKHLKTKPPVNIGDKVRVSFDTKKALQATLLYQSDDPSAIRSFDREARLAEARSRQVSTPKIPKGRAKAPVRRKIQVEPNAPQPPKKKLVTKKAAQVKARVVPRRDIASTSTAPDPRTYFPELSFASSAPDSPLAVRPSSPASPPPPPSPLRSLPSPASPSPPPSPLPSLPLSPSPPPSPVNAPFRRDDLLEVLVEEIRLLRRAIEERLPVPAPPTPTPAPPAPTPAPPAPTPAPPAPTPAPPAPPVPTTTPPVPTTTPPVPTTTPPVPSTTPPPPAHTPPTDTSPCMSDRELQFLRASSCSVGNFAVQVAKRLFTRDELKEGNCSGSRGKTALDHERLGFIYQRVPSLWGVPEGDRQETVRKCRIAIDLYARKLK